jgi:branched-chain amino acid transport system ATP-binding protein
VIVDQIVGLLHRLAGENLTLLLVEQNVGVALDVCERFVVLRAGRTVFEGGKEQLGAAPREFLAQLYL